VAECREAGLPTRYGDAEDPDVFEHLPLEGTQWVVNAAPGRTVNLALLGALKARSYRGKVALTAHSEAEAAAFRAAGADRVLWPFVDAAEQAVDGLAGTVDEILESYPWPVTLSEVRVRSDAAAAGRTLQALDLRSRTGATVLAVTRAGQSRFDLSPDFQVFPGDRLVLVGSRENLEEAAAVLREVSSGGVAPSRFRISEIGLGHASPWVGRSLAELDLPTRHRVTVIGIRRDGEQILTVGAQEVLRAGDRLAIAGPAAAIEALAAVHPATAVT
jgi:Trk K+ transport system NAD-binding subunit